MSIGSTGCQLVPTTDAQAAAAAACPPWRWHHHHHQRLGNVACASPFAALTLALCAMCCALAVVQVGASSPSLLSSVVAWHTINETYIDVLLNFTTAADFAARDQAAWPVLRALCRVPPALHPPPGLVPSLRELEQHLAEARAVQRGEPTHVQLCRPLGFHELRELVGPVAAAAPPTQAQQAAMERDFADLPAVFAHRFRGNRVVLPFDGGKFLMTIAFLGTPGALSPLLHAINNGSFARAGVAMAFVVQDPASVLGVGEGASGFGVDLVEGQTELSLGWHVILVVGTLLVGGVVFTFYHRKTRGGEEAPASAIMGSGAGPRTTAGEGDVGDDDEDEDDAEASNEDTGGDGLAGHSRPISVSAVQAAHRRAWEENDVGAEMDVRLRLAAEREEGRLKSLVCGTSVAAIATRQRCLAGAVATSLAAPLLGNQQDAATVSASRGKHADDEAATNITSTTGVASAFPPELQRHRDGLPVDGPSSLAAAAAAGSNGGRGRRVAVRKKDFSLERLQHAIAFSNQLTLPPSHEAIDAQEREELQQRAEAQQAQARKMEQQQQVEAEHLTLPPVKTAEDLEAEEQQRIARSKRAKEERGLVALGSLGLQARRMAAMMSRAASSQHHGPTQCGEVRRGMMRASQLPRHGRVRAFLSMSGDTTPRPQQQLQQLQQQEEDVGDADGRQLEVRLLSPAASVLAVPELAEGHDTTIDLEDL